MSSSSSLLNILASVFILFSAVLIFGKHHKKWLDALKRESIFTYFFEKCLEAEEVGAFNVCSGKTMWKAYQEMKEAQALSSNCGKNCDLYFHCMASYKAVYNCPGSMKDKRTTAKYISSIDAKEFATALGDPIPTTSSPPPAATSTSSKTTKSSGRRHIAAVAAAKEQKKREENQAAAQAAAAENGRFGEDCEKLYLNSKMGCNYQPQTRKC